MKGWQAWRRLRNLQFSNVNSLLTKPIQPKKYILCTEICGWKPPLSGSTACIVIHLTSALSASWLTREKAATRGRLFTFTVRLQHPLWRCVILHGLYEKSGYDLPPWDSSISWAAGQQASIRLPSGWLPCSLKRLPGQAKAHTFQKINICKPQSWRKWMCGLHTE